MKEEEKHCVRRSFDRFIYLFIYFCWSKNEKQGNRYFFHTHTHTHTGERLGKPTISWGGNDDDDDDVNVRN
jgi:hypothetical protein